ncbi:hypothetical protein [Shouchella shacheensis]|uniref:hypothetical protein n=1 Tax=Shouchella shacheensis TaxID=1649580 RepID=UPI000740311B|nr:hypothetical protein [Shouchella shacheensis]
MLTKLQEQYAWDEARFVTETLVETTQGRKRIHLWQDETLLNWHILWRDRCSVTPYVLVDRMIRTTEGKPYLKWKHRYVTVHDDLQEHFPQKGREGTWGMLLASMIENGLGTNHVATEEAPAPRYAELSHSLSSMEEAERQMVRRLMTEASVREKKAGKLLRSTNASLPIMDRVEETKQAKTTFDVLVWYGTTARPERGYYSLVRFLKEWRQRNGEESLLRLLEGIPEKVILGEDQGALMLAEALKPYELNHVAECVGKCSAEDLKHEVKRALKEWEQTRGFVSLMANWLDQKKVTT